MIPTRARLDDFNAIALPEKPRQSPWGRLSEVEIKPIRFLDKPLWQADAFHLLVGEKGCGKGTFLADLAARVTKGELGDRRTVIWIAAGEDSLSIDVKPRILAAGGDPELIAYPRQRLLLPECVKKLQGFARLLGDVGLIVLDPITGMLGGEKSSNEDLSIRSALDPLNHLADELECLVVGVRHMGKDRSRGALASVLGTVDWINVPRAVTAIAVDEDDSRHVQVIAGNRVSRSEGSTRFWIVPTMIEGLDEPVTQVQFDGPGKDVEDLLSVTFRSSTKTNYAKEIMLDALDEGEVESDSLTAMIAKESGLAAKTVKNIKTALKDDGLIGFRPGEKDGSGHVTRWLVYRTLAPRPVLGTGQDGTRDGGVPTSVPDGGREVLSSTSRPPLGGTGRSTSTKDLRSPSGLDHCSECGKPEVSFDGMCLGCAADQ